MRGSFQKPRTDARNSATDDNVRNPVHRRLSIRDGYEIDYRRQIDGAARCDAVRLHLTMIRLTDVLELHIQCEFRLYRADTNAQRWLEVVWRQDIHRDEAWRASSYLVGIEQELEHGLLRGFDLLCPLKMHRFCLHVYTYDPIPLPRRDPEEPDRPSMA